MNSDERIHNKYMIEKEIKRGAFGIILKGFVEKNREPVAIKIEHGGVDSLKHEVKIMNYLAASGVKKIPSIYWYGIHNQYPCLVFSYYECSLFDYMKTREVTVSKMNILMLKILDILEHIHKFFTIHRDIKPHNFMIKDGDIFLIDFGLATFYITDSGEHFPNSIGNTMVGTPKFASIHIHQGCRYSRRDDLISLGYLYLCMILGDCPWLCPDADIHSAIHNTTKSIIDIEHPMNLHMKSNKEYYFLVRYIEVSPLDLVPLQNYMKYVYSLEYDETPKYTPLKMGFIAPC